jgi:hypothetical protein
MEKNRSFKYFFTRISLSLMLIGSVASSLNASFYNATSMTKTTPNEPQRHIHLISDVHTAHPDLKIQGKDTVEAIAKNPENTCVMVELNDSCATDQIAKATATLPNGIFCYVSTECAQKGIETINFDFRSFITDDGKKSLCLKYTPEKISVSQFVKIIDKQIDETQEVLTQGQLDSWKKLKHICTLEKFAGKTLADIYAYCDLQHADDNATPGKQEIINYTHELIDAKIIHHINSTDKTNIFIVAGGSHLLTVREYLEQQGYTLCCDHGITTEQALEIYENNKAQPNQLAQAIPRVNMGTYFSEVYDIKTNDFFDAIATPAILMWHPFIIT